MSHMYCSNLEVGMEVHNTYVVWYEEIKYGVVC
jgi:hypothetical protein